MLLSSIAENYLSVTKVVATNSVNFSAFGAFWWKYFFQLVIHIWRDIQENFKKVKIKVAF